MSKMKKLSELLPDEKGIVLSVNSRDEIRRRLLDMGLIPGTQVACAFKSPWGDPTAYLIRGALVALRHDDADEIFVTEKYGGV